MINDHSKNHGDWVIDRLATWKTAAKKSPELQWIIRHATRTLVKKGHPGALALHGVEASNITVLSQKVLTPKVRIGQKLQVSLRVRNDDASPRKVILDHEIGFLKSNGKHSPKVFKGKTLELAPRETRELELDIPLRQVTTRVYYPGRQFWLPLVNGIKGKPLAFELS